MDSPDKEKTLTLTNAGRGMVAVFILALGSGLSYAALKFGK